MHVLQEWMANNEVSQADLASDIDVSPGAIYQWITHRTEPKLKHVRKLAQRTGIDVARLVAAFAASSDS